MSLEVTKIDSQQPVWLVINVEVSMVMAENLSVNIAVIVEKGLYNKMSYILPLQIVS